MAEVLWLNIVDGSQKWSDEKPYRAGDGKGWVPMYRVSMMGGKLSILRWLMRCCGCRTIPNCETGSKSR